MYEIYFKSHLYISSLVNSIRFFLHLKKQEMAQIWFGDLELETDEW
jgi:hypothetical protein